MLRLFILAQAVACYRQTPIAPPVPVHVSAPEPVAKPPSCPIGDGLKARAAALVGVVAVDGATCVSGRFPRPGWMIITRHLNAGGAWSERRMVVGPRGEVIAFDDTEWQRRPETQSVIERIEAFDFDRDGMDEVVTVLTSHYRGYDFKHLQILRLVANRWEPVLTRQLEYAEPVGGANVVSCEATWRITGTTVVVAPVTTATGHCVDTTEIWSLGPDGTFVR